MLSVKPPKESKPQKEKKVYYSSRGGAGRSKSAGPAPRKQPASSAPSKLLEVPIPMHKTTATGRGGGGNARTFVVEEGTFARVMEHEIGRIKAIKEAEGKRKIVSLRGGAVMPEKEKKEQSPTTTQNSGSDFDDQASTKSTAPRFPHIPLFRGSMFSRERGRPTSPVSQPPSGGSGPAVPTLSVPSPSHSHPSVSDRYSPTYQSGPHAVLTQASLDLPPPTPTTPGSLFKPVHPGVLLYVPEDSDTDVLASPPSSTTSLPYLRNSSPCPSSIIDFDLTEGLPEY